MLMILSPFSTSCYSVNEALSGDTLDPESLFPTMKSMLDEEQLANPNTVSYPPKPTVSSNICAGLSSTTCHQNANQS